MKRTDILFALMAVVVFSACTRDGEAIADAGQESVASMTPPELRLSCYDVPAATRAGSDVQTTQLVSGTQVDVFLQDGGDDSTYPTPITYTADGSGGLAQTTVASLFWPKLMRSLAIYGVSPVGAASSGTRTDESIDFSPFAFANWHYFTVAADQSSVANYTASDLMTGFPSSPTPDVPPCTLNQDGDEGTVNLAFTHRLTKIIINVTPSTKIQTGEGKVVPTDINDARITLLNIKRMTSFKAYPMSDLGAAAVADDAITTVIAGNGSSVACIIPPQTITASSSTPFIQIDLYDNGSVTDTFYYTPESDLVFDASKVYTFNVTLDKPSLTVTVNSITAWTSGDSDQTGTAVLQPTE
jgi:hypothetical protein